MSRVIFYTATNEHTEVDDQTAVDDIAAGLAVPSVEQPTKKQAPAAPENKDLGAAPENK